MVAARGAHHLLGQGRDLAVLLGGRWYDLVGGDRVVEPGEAQQDGHSFPRDEVVRVMFMVGSVFVSSGQFFRSYSYLTSWVLPYSCQFCVGVSQQCYILLGLLT